MATHTASVASRSLDTLPCIHPNAAGLDIGADDIYACVPADHDPQPVRAFATFTADLAVLADWLLHCGIDTVAMESTGIYWLPIYEMLEARGIRVFLVNAHHIKIPPGRKSDWKDCQWIQRLHTLGLLQASFRPDAEMVVLRSYLRHRTELIQHRAPHILHMQKALHQMNIQLDRVLSDITMQVRSRANQALRQAAQSVARSDSAVGASDRALRAWRGPGQAIVATAHQIARIVYHLLKSGEPYREEGAAEYEQKRKARERKHLARRAQKLGYTLAPVPVPAPESQPEGGGKGSC